MTGQRDAEGNGAALDRTIGRVRFEWSDPLLLERELADDERLVRDTARAYAQERLLPRVRDAFRHERFDRDIVLEMGRLGFLGSTL
jgi:glutaryl-CoA dehydrogenase